MSTVDRVREIAADVLKHTHTYGKRPFDTFMDAESLLAGWVADALAAPDLTDFGLEYAKERALARQDIAARRDRMMARRQRDKAAWLDIVKRTL